MASDAQRLARIKREIQRRGLLKPQETLLTKKNLSNDDYTELWRILLTKVLPEWSEGARMFPEDKDLAELVKQCAAFLNDINAGLPFDFLTKPPIQYAFNGIPYESEAQADAAFQAYLDEQEKKNDPTLLTQKEQAWQKELKLISEGEG